VKRLEAGTGISLQDAAHLFFRLVSRRYERGAMLVTSNRAVGEWGTVFGDAVVATAILDRLLHHSHVVTIRGDSCPAPRKASQRAFAKARCDARNNTCINLKVGQFFMSPQGQIRMSLDKLAPNFLFLPSGDLDMKRLNQHLMRAQGGSHLRDIRVHSGILSLQSQDHRLQGGGIVRQDFGRIGHGSPYHEPCGNTIKTNKNKVISRQLGRAVRPGLDAASRSPAARQRMLACARGAHSTASCAEVKRTAPSCVVGHGNRPRSGTLP